MKKIFARISMELVVSDEEAEQIFEEAGYDYDCVTGTKCNNEFDISDDFAKRFLKEGTYSEGSSYIPQDCISEV
jgi:hypothetical protein